MKIEIKQQCIPTGGLRASPWLVVPFQRIVWTSDVGAVQNAAMPDGFVPGLLTGVVDGKSVDLFALDEALATIGVTRSDIQAAIGLSAVSRPINT